MWTEGDEPGGRVSLPAGEGITLLDVVGRKLASPAVSLSASPMYLVGLPGKAKELLATVKVAQ